MGSALCRSHRVVHMHDASNEVGVAGLSPIPFGRPTASSANAEGESLEPATGSGGVMGQPVPSQQQRVAPHPYNGAVIGSIVLSDSVLIEIDRRFEQVLSNQQLILQTLKQITTQPVLTAATTTDSKRDTASVIPPQSVLPPAPALAPVPVPVPTKMVDSVVFFRVGDGANELQPCVTAVHSQLCDILQSRSHDTHMKWTFAPVRDSGDTLSHSTDTKSTGSGGSSRPQLLVLFWCCSGLRSCPLGSVFEATVTKLKQQTGAKEVLVQGVKHQSTSAPAFWELDDGGMSSSGYGGWKQRWGAIAGYCDQFITCDGSQLREVNTKYQILPKLFDAIAKHIVM